MTHPYELAIEVIGSNAFENDWRTRAFHEFNVRTDPDGDRKGMLATIDELHSLAVSGNSADRDAVVAEVDTIRQTMCTSAAEYYPNGSGPKKTWDETFDSLSNRAIVLHALASTNLGRCLGFGPDKEGLYAASFELDDHRRRRRTGWRSDTVATSLDMLTMLVESRVDPAAAAAARLEGMIGKVLLSLS